MWLFKGEMSMRYLLFISIAFMLVGCQEQVDYYDIIQRIKEGDVVCASESGENGCHHAMYVDSFIDGKREFVRVVDVTLYEGYHVYELSREGDQLSLVIDSKSYSVREIRREMDEALVTYTAILEDNSELQLFTINIGTIVD